MMVLDADAIAALLPYDQLVLSLRKGLAQRWQAPQRIHYGLGNQDSMLLMPAWGSSHLGLKLANVFPGNAAHGLPMVSSSYLLCDATSGKMLAILDGEILTSRRTAAVAALAASFLAPRDAEHMLVVGAGRVARELPAAFAAVRPIKRVSVWARNPDRAAELARDLVGQGFEAAPCFGLAETAAAVSIIACATFSSSPIILGEWLGGETHLSLIGGFTPSMREADSEAVRRSLVVADTRSGVLAEAGDILIPISEGVIDPSHVRADLVDLCRDERALVLAEGQGTLFKCVGHAVQDLIAATLCMPS